MSGTLPEPSTARGRGALDRLLREPRGGLVAADFDGTLSPIVARPDQAYAHPDAAAALGEVASAGYRVAIVTGRPVTDVLRLGSGIADVPGLVIYGHYGMERWVDGETTAPEPHPGVEAARREVADIVAAAPAGVAVEDKVRSVALHTRRAAEPGATLEQLRDAAETLAGRHGLEVVPGRYVLELRPPGLDKGVALRRLVADTGARTVVFAGDDLGDLPAVAALHELDVDALVVCSDSEETPVRLREAADLVVDGPAGVVALFRAIARATMAGPQP